ncbi:free fatty acid receptor 3-like [Ambystoma mexicanum]|uniref:free fatty acid receptor 3-like n=1 Tax=Ambystoma mexicanum TaxID=8296 RepID=UPI0037E89A15
MNDYFPGAQYLYLTVYIVTFVTGLPTNIIALCTFITKFRRKVVPVDILLINLTVSDLLLLLFLPFKMAEATSGMKWRLPYFLCPLSRFLFFSSIYLTTMFLAAVSVERYVGVAYPVKYKLFRKPVYYVVFSILTWFLALSHCSVVYIVQHYLPLNESSHNFTALCYSKFSREQLAILLPVRLEMCLFLFCFPFIITTFCYSHFIKIIMSQQYMSKARKKRAIGLVGATLLNFIICFIPYNISHIVGYIQGDSPSWRAYALLMSTFNASVDPIIFYFSSSAFQKIVWAGMAQMMKTLHLSCYNFSTFPSTRDNETGDTRTDHGS